MNTTSGKRTRKRKPPYLQYAVLLGIVVWAVALTILVLTLMLQNVALQKMCVQMEEDNRRIEELYVNVSTQLQEIEDKLSLIYPEGFPDDTSSVQEHSENEGRLSTPSTSLSGTDEVSDYIEAPYVFSSAAERDLIERVVMAESGNQCYEGQVAVAQCIFNTSMAKDTTAAYVVSQKGQYASPYSGEVTDSVKEAVSAVFDRGEQAIEDTVRYFYSTVGGFVSQWHETSPNLEYVETIEDHKFFKVKGE